MSFVYNLADTWNAGGTTFNSILMNVSNGSGGAPVGAAASRVLNLQNNGTSVFAVDVNGGAVATGTTSSDVALGVGASNTGWYLPVANVMSLALSGTQYFQVTTTALNLVQNGMSIGLGSSTDLVLSRNGSGQLNINAGANGQQTGIFSLTESLTLNTGATTTNSVNQIPANAILLAASVRVTTTITTATSFTVTGTSSSTTFNTASVGVASGSTDPGTKAGAFYNATAQTVTITTNVNPGAGVVRLSLHYILITPPTS